MILAAVTAGLNAAAGIAKAIGAYLGLVHDAKEQQAGVTQQRAADQAATIKGDADARKVEARSAGDTDADQLARMRTQREAATRRQ